MATQKNKRSALKPKKEESDMTKKLRARLKEDYDHFMNEDDEPIDDDLGLGGEGGPEEGGEESFGGGEGEFAGGEEDDLGLGGEGEDVGDLEGDEEYTDPTAELTPNQDETFDEFTDELLEPEYDLLQQEEETGEDALDGPLTAPELGDIIDSDDTYHELGTTLATVAQDDEGDFGGGEFSGEEDEEGDFGGEGDFENGFEEGFEDGEEDGDDLNFDEEEDFSDIEESVMLEAEVEQEIDNTMRENLKRKNKRKLKEETDVYAGATVPDEFKETDSDLQKPFGKVTDSKTAKKIDTKPKFGSVTGAKDPKKVDTKPTFKKVTATSGEGGAGGGKKVAISEEIKKSKMLVEASKQIALLKKEASKFKLEAYKVTKANGILTAVGDKLDKETRLKISESFDKCDVPGKVDALYKKLVTVIREKSHDSLNETVQKRKSSIASINTLKENKEFMEEQQNLASQKEARIRMLMGINGYDDSYFG